MKIYISFIVPLLAILFVSCSSQRYTDRDDYNRRYGNVLANDNYYNVDYGSGWYSLERMRVAARKEEKKFSVSRRDGKDVSQLLFRTDGPVNIHRVALKYSNGKTEELRVPARRNDRRNNSELNEDMIVRVPDYGRARVRQVSFWYDVNNRTPFSKRPVVSVFAR